MAAPRLFDQVRERIRVEHYSLRTEEAYLHWIRRFIFFRGERQPRDMQGDRRDLVLSENGDCHHFHFSRAGDGWSSPRSMRVTMAASFAWLGAGTPPSAPLRAMKPFIASISVRRPLRMSCAIEGRWMSSRGLAPALGTSSVSTSASAAASPSAA